MRRFISYDIADDKLRSHFSKMLQKNGAVRAQLSVYEVNNTKRIVENLMIKIEAYARHFTMADSVLVIDLDAGEVKRYGAASLWEQPVAFL